MHDAVCLAPYRVAAAGTSLGLIFVAAAAMCAGTLGGCAVPKFAYDYYDECSKETASFTAMAACGKRQRTASCQKDGFCSADGDAMVAYADSLAELVDGHKITEPEAQRMWMEFLTLQAHAQGELLAKQAAKAKAAAPKKTFPAGGGNC